MFAGIVEGTGNIVRLEQSADGSGNRRLDVELGDLLGDSSLGASIAINGACLTLAESRGSIGGFDVVPETLRLTNLGDLKTGDSVNVERSLCVGDRIDGHFVQGHIDGVGIIEKNGAAGGEWTLRVCHSPEVGKFILRKGSITIDGVSLTVVDVEPGAFSVALIPTTIERTILGRRGVGDRVNLETDSLARIVLSRIDSLINPAATVSQSSGVTIEQLRASGLAV